MLGDDGDATATADAASPSTASSSLVTGRATANGVSAGNSIGALLHPIASRQSHVAAVEIFVAGVVQRSFQQLGTASMTSIDDVAYSLGGFTGATCTVNLSVETALLLTTVSIDMLAHVSSVLESTTAVQLAALAMPLMRRRSRRAM